MKLPSVPFSLKEYFSSSLSSPEGKPTNTNKNLVIVLLIVQFIHLHVYFDVQNIFWVQQAF